MEEREFARYAFLIVAVVAVVGLLTSGGGITGFAAKVGLKAPTVSCDKAKQMVAAYCKDNPGAKRCKDAQKLEANLCKARPAPRSAPRPAQRQAPPAPEPAPAAEQQAAPQPAPEPAPAQQCPFPHNYQTLSSRCDGNVQINRSLDCSGREVERVITCPSYPNNAYTCVGVAADNTLCAPCGSRVCETPWGINWFDASYQGDACVREITRVNCGEA